MLIPEEGNRIVWSKCRNNKIHKILKEFNCLKIYFPKNIDKIISLFMIELML